jgi:chromatin remodeling complex protein RSC6
MSEDANKNIFDAFTTINNSLTLFKMQFNTLQLQVRTLEKNVKKEMKPTKKECKLLEPKPKKAPSGFAKPTKVTKELCEFMDKPEGTEIARTEVTKVLVNYIKTNNLQELTAVSKNKIVPDDKLKTLLGLNVEETNELTFFNIQKYMNKHFISKKLANNTLMET